MSGRITERARQLQATTDEQLHTMYQDAPIFERAAARLEIERRRDRNLCLNCYGVMTRGGKLCRYCYERRGS